MSLDLAQKIKEENENAIALLEAAIIQLQMAGALVLRCYQENEMRDVEDKDKKYLKRRLTGQHTLTLTWFKPNES